MQETIQWKTVRAAQRRADPEHLTGAGVVALTAALHLVGELGPYLVGEDIVRERLRVALARCRRLAYERGEPTLHLIAGRRGA